MHLSNPILTSAEIIEVYQFIGTDGSPNISFRVIIDKMKLKYWKLEWEKSARWYSTQRLIIF